MWYFPPVHENQPKQSIQAKSIPTVVSPPLISLFFPTRMHISHKVSQHPAPKTLFPVGGQKTSSLRSWTRGVIESHEFLGLSHKGKVDEVFHRTYTRWCSTDLEKVFHQPPGWVLGRFVRRGKPHATVKNQYQSFAWYFTPRSTIAVSNSLSKRQKGFKRQLLGSMQWQ